MDVNIQEDLNAVNDQITKLVDELNKVNAARENLIQQVQNLNGVGMYLRGKLPPTDEGSPVVDGNPDNLERTTEYPDTAS